MSTPDSIAFAAVRRIAPYAGMNPTELMQECARLKLMLEAECRMTKELQKRLAMLQKQMEQK
jgi:hypothetical protein